MTSTVQVRQYKSERAYERGAAKMIEAGWRVQSMDVTESRRASGCLFGLIGYWLFPKKVVYHVVYTWPQPRAHKRR